MRASISSVVALSLTVASFFLTGCGPALVAGVGTGAFMAGDRRTSGAFIEDEVIENKVQRRIKDYYGNRVHVNAVSFNQNVLLAGQVPSEEIKGHVTTLAQEVERVRTVYNETQIMPILPLTARSEDTLLTSKVKTRFLNAQQFNANHVKVYTEDGIVYLMGIVTHEEANSATNIARETEGVKKVVRLFEYGTH